MKTETKTNLVGRVVYIYYDPITENEVEGEGRIKKVISNQYGMIYAEVSFIDEPYTTYERRVSLVGKNKRVLQNDH